MVTRSGVPVAEQKPWKGRSVTGEGKSVARAALDADRAYRAAVMRDKGQDWTSIARKLGYDQASDALAEVEDWRKDLETETENLRDLENRRLDLVRRMIHDAIDMAEADTREDADPVPEILKGAEGLRRLTETSIKLNGLAAPQKVEVAQTTKYEIVGVDPSELL